MASQDLAQIVQGLSSQVDAAVGQRRLGKGASHGNEESSGKSSHGNEESSGKAFPAGNPGRPGVQASPLRVQLFADTMLTKLRRVSGQNKLVEVDHSSNAAFMLEKKDSFTAPALTMARSARSTIKQLTNVISGEFRRALPAASADVEPESRGPASPVAHARERRGSLGSLSLKAASEDEATNEQVCQFLLAGSSSPQISRSRSLPCTGARRNLAACGTHQGNGKRRFAPPLRAGDRMLPLPPPVSAAFHPRPGTD